MADVDADDRDFKDDDAGQDSSVVQPEAKETKAGPKRRELLVEQTVISERLVREAVVEDLQLYYDKSVIDKPEQIDLTTVSRLVLSFRNILVVDNLIGFEKLTKLQLDNNVIERIENLDHLVNLTWLDLSFNNITKIENLDKLVHLKDLSLFSNKIKRIEGLDALKSLEILSLGNNRIADLHNVKDLRHLRSLRSLNLKGNPVCSDDDYQLTIWAFLNQLTYLDYQIIEQAQRDRARDAKLEYMAELEESDLQAEETRKRNAELQARKKELAEANLGGVDELFSSMTNFDPEWKRMQDLLKLRKNEIYNKYWSIFDKHTQDHILIMLQKHKEKQEEYKLFFDSVSAVRARTEHLSVDKIQSFEAATKRAFRAWELSIGSGDARPELLEEVRAQVQLLVDELLDLEMTQSFQLNAMIEEFSEVYREMCTANVQRISAYFKNLAEAADIYGSDLQAFVQELERIQKEKAAAAEASGPSASSSSSSAHAHAHAAAPGAAGAGGAGGKADDGSVLRQLPSSKEELVNAIQTSRDKHTEFIQKSEDYYTTKERDLTENLISSTKSGEYQRNRKRVSEIHALADRYRARVDRELAMLDD